jgi:hypothetical protein
MVYHLDQMGTTFFLNVANFFFQVCERQLALQQVQEQAGQHPALRSIQSLPATLER